jgi:hypothetical protein
VIIKSRTFLFDTGIIPALISARSFATCESISIRILISLNQLVCHFCGDSRMSAPLDVAYVDLTDCRIVSDRHGKPLRVDIPYPLFSMLVHFRSAALSAQTRHVERCTPRNAFKGSLSKLPSGAEPEAITAGEAATSRSHPGLNSPARARAESLFIVSPAAEKTNRSAETAPEAVLMHIRSGMSPLTAWRLYRGLTLSELGSAYGTSGEQIRALEVSPLSDKTRARLAKILRCEPWQL